MRCLTIALALSFAAMGCGPTFEATKPPGFVEIESDADDYDYRAASADGLVMAVREIDHDPKGESEFWVKAIKNRMRERGGYAFLEEVPVVSGDGVKGTQLRFGHDEDSGEPHLYYVTLFVTDASLYLLEVGGTKKQVLESASSIERAVHGFRTR